MTETEADRAAREHRAAATANRRAANAVFREARDRALANGLSAKDAQRAGNAAEEAWWNE